MKKKNGRYGAQCLFALVLSTFDEYIIKATKMLFDAGAKNVCVGEKEDEDETPWNFVSMEGSYQDTCLHNHHLGNIYEAVYQMYQAVDEGRPYKGIDSYMAAIGKRIVRIFAEKPANGEIFYDMNLPTSKHKNCFNQNLYFIFDGGFLISTQFTELWVDTILPSTTLIDVSNKFCGIIGNTIKKITFDHKEVVECYGQPVTIIEMDDGAKLIFSINFGEVNNDAERAAYYSLQLS